MQKQPAIYILANKPHGTLYTGVTSNIIQRVYQHKNKLAEGFSRKYDCNLLVYYELYDDMVTAISREKQIKGGSRQKKIALINAQNPKWQDLYGNLTG